jgi:hypothetical protein
MTLAALMKHLALVEVYYFTFQLHGRPMPPPWDGGDFDADPCWEWRTAPEDDPDYLRDLWLAAVRRSRAAIDDVLVDAGLGQKASRKWPDGDIFTLRRFLVDLIEEYARHTGHADLLRESVDGETGERPPPDLPVVP